MRAVGDAMLEFVHGDAILWVPFENHAKDLIELIREWQDGLQEVAAPGKRPVGGIIIGGLLPWVTPAGQVDQDDTKGPDIIGSAAVGRFS